MKRKASFIITLWWLLACAVIGIVLMITSDKDGKVSESENRVLQPFPKLTASSLMSGSFMTDFDSFLSDAFFDRDGVTAFTENLLSVCNVMSKDERLEQRTAEMESALDAEGGSDTEAETADDAAYDLILESLVTPEPTATPEPVAVADAASETLPSGALAIAASVVNSETQVGPVGAKESYQWFDKNDGNYKIQYTLDNSKINYYAETLKIMQTYLPEDGQIFFTEVPLAQTANNWLDNKEKYCGWGSSEETTLRGALEGTERIYVFSTYDILEPYVDGEPRMFYVSDHHWSAEAAYKVCAEMLKAQGLPVIPYEEYEYKSIKSSDTSESGEHDTFNVLYPLLPSKSLVITHRDQSEQIALMNYDSSTYRAYLNNTRLPWRRIITGANTGRNALILCDSFGNDFTPYLMPYYDEIHMADFREGSYDKSEAGGSISEMMQYYGVDDVYIIVSQANGLRKDNSIVYLRKYLLE